MSTPQHETVWARTLAWIGTGATMVALAFTVRPVHVSAWVFWVVVAAGIVAVASGCFRLVRLWLTRAPGDAQSPCGRTATECRRVQEALSAFADERSRERPRAGLFTANAQRLDVWRDETVAQYRNELRSWATGVFAEAVACGAVSDSARPLVEAPSAAQISTLRDLFRDAAEELEGRRG